VSVTEQLLAVYGNLTHTLVSSAPRVVLGAALVALTLVVAKIIERVLRSVLVGVHLDAGLQQIGLDKTLGRLGVKQPPSLIVPRLAYFLVLVLVAQAAADFLGMASLSRGIAALFDYLPNVVAAVVLIVAGSATSQFAGRMVAEAAESSGIEFAASLGSLVAGVILFVVGVMAVAQLKIDTDIVRIVTTCSLAGLALAFGLSFGLGTRDITRNIVAGFYARKIFQVGTEMEIKGERGILKAITPTQTLLEQGGRIVAVANTTFLEEVVKQ
jgi:hypothetical protein